MPRATTPLLFVRRSTTASDSIIGSSTEPTQASSCSSSSACLKPGTARSLKRFVPAAALLPQALRRVETGYCSPDECAGEDPAQTPSVLHRAPCKWDTLLPAL